MRLVGLQPGRSQRALADQLGVAPTKIVSLVGGLEARDYWNADATPDRRHQRVPANRASNRVYTRGTAVASKLRDLSRRTTNSNRRRVLKICRGRKAKRPVGRFNAGVRIGMR
jgi:hypothetical protein